MTHSSHLLTKNFYDILRRIFSFDWGNIFVIKIYYFYFKNENCDFNYALSFQLLASAYLPFPAPQIQLPASSLPANTYILSPFSINIIPQIRYKVKCVRRD